MRKPRPEHPPASLLTPCLELAAEQRAALAHPHDPVLGAGAPTVSRSIVEHFDLHRLRGVAHRDGRSSLPGVLDRVGERLLDGPILRSGIFPKAWAWLSFALAGVLLIPPVGWAALLIGLPLWVIGTSVLLQRGRATPVPATT